MFIYDTNSRVQKDIKGIRFNESDVFCCKYAFEKDITIDICLDYVSPGFGVVMGEASGGSLRDSKIAYLFKIGANDFYVFKKNYSIQKILSSGTNVLEPAIDAEGQHIIFSVNDRAVRLTYVMTDETGAVQEYLLGKYTLEKKLSKYYIGFYSNAGNIIRSTVFKGGIPEHWNLSTDNTRGGRVGLFEDGFLFENCDHDAELEQFNIELDAGTYWLKYEKEKLNDNDDIIAYVFPSEPVIDPEHGFHDEEKNILSKDNKFSLLQPGKINLKFKGTSGKVKNIAISDNLNSHYISTENNTGHTEGSTVIIILDNLKRVVWEANTLIVPENNSIMAAPSYSLLETIMNSYSIDDLNVKLNTVYKYEFNVESKELAVYDNSNNKLIRKVIVTIVDDDQNRLRIFRGTKTTIYNITLYHENGTVTDIIHQRTTKRYVPSSINGPIIVTDEDNNPYDISASYREVAKKKKKFVVYSNQAEFKIPEPLPPSATSIAVYGVPAGAHFNIDADNIDEFVSKYKKIEDYHITQKPNIVELDSSIKESWPKFIVEYESVDDYYYKFTNYERELFSADTDSLFLEKDISKTNMDIVVYGIPKTSYVNKEMLYRVQGDVSGTVSDYFDMIDYFADQYEIIPGSEYQINFDANGIDLKRGTHENYMYFIVDYLKADSYAINLLDDIAQYEVDISSEKQNVILHYDMRDDNNMYKYKRTEIVPSGQKYVVLRKVDGS